MTGIEPLEARGRLVADMLCRTENYRQWKPPLWSYDQNIESFTRTMLREDMEELLGGQLTKILLQELQEVLFTIVYSTYVRKVSGQI